MLFTKDGKLKCTDFGIARKFGTHLELMTNQICTRWYRAPELIYGTRNYGPEIDMWSVGCIFAELLMRKPLFPGQSDIDQISKIVGICGCPNVIKFLLIVLGR